MFILSMSLISKAFARIAFSAGTGNTGAVRCRERLGGLLKYYEREAA
jgi:hypothetical protein